MKILKETHVPNEVTVIQLEKIVGRIFEVNYITFSDDELPVEGAGHNQGLYITIKCELWIFIGEIELLRTIGTVDFTGNFQVLDINTSYNLLLGRPYVHRVGTVPSTLHQMIKFKYDRQLVIFHGEGTC